MEAVEAVECHHYDESLRLKHSNHLRSHLPNQSPPQPESKEEPASTERSVLPTLDKDSATLESISQAHSKKPPTYLDPPHPQITTLTPHTTPCSRSPFPPPNTHALVPHLYPHLPSPRSHHRTLRTTLCPYPSASTSIIHILIHIPLLPSPSPSPSHQTQPFAYIPSPPSARPATQCAYQLHARPSSPTRDVDHGGKGEEKRGALAHAMLCQAMPCEEARKLEVLHCMRQGHRVWLSEARVESVACRRRGKTETAVKE